MSKKRIIVSIFVILLGIILNILVLRYEKTVEEEKTTIEVTLMSTEGNDFQLFYLMEEQSYPDGFSEDQCVLDTYNVVDQEQILKFEVPAAAKYIRMDFGSLSSDTIISKFVVTYKDEEKVISGDELENIEYQNSIENTYRLEDSLVIESQDGDPHVIWNSEAWNMDELVVKADTVKNNCLKALVCVVFDLILICVLVYAKKIVFLPVELYQNRKLILNLAKNDFKTRFAGSYLGIVWAFVQPIVTVLVYWFVFEKGLKAGGINMKAGITVPYVLWLIAGLVPWFFFSEALNSGTNALIEYSYLVKKVVFKISILPIVKVVSALFVHIFFIAFTVVLYCGYQYYPDLYTLQILYYSFAMLVLVLALVYTTCAIVVFFRDLSQIINIILQVGVWMTPIMWNIDTMELSPILLTIFKLNPMYYIVEGYRDTLINKVWFWERPELTVYYWLMTAIVFGIGTVIFRRLKVHFADVL